MPDPGQDDQVLIGGESTDREDPVSPVALYELERVRFIDGVEIDHPEGPSASNGMGDAPVRVIQHA